MLVWKILVVGLKYKFCEITFNFQGKQAIQEINIYAIVAIFFRPPLKQFFVCCHLPGW